MSSPAYFDPLSSAALESWCVVFFAAHDIYILSVHEHNLFRKAERQGSGCNTIRTLPQDRTGNLLKPLSPMPVNFRLIELDEYLSVA